MRIVRQMASALGAAHERGMVHRDLKPANIMLTDHPDYPEFVKVLDFGIAKLLGAAQTPAGHHTEVGTLLGTPAYMSPEQCLGDIQLDHRSDIYSLGVILFLMLSGRLPFEDEAIGRLILAHVNQPAPPLSLICPPRSPPRWPPWSPARWPRNPTSASPPCASCAPPSTRTRSRSRIETPPGQ